MRSSVNTDDSEVCLFFIVFSPIGINTKERNQWRCIRDKLWWRRSCIFSSKGSSSSFMSLRVQQKSNRNQWWKVTMDLICSSIETIKVPKQNDGRSSCHAHSSSVVVWWDEEVTATHFLLLSQTLTWKRYKDPFLATIPGSDDVSIPGSGISTLIYYLLTMICHKIQCINICCDFKVSKSK